MSNPSTSATASDPAAAPQPGRSGLWAMACVLIVLLLVVGIPLGYVIMTWSHAAIEGPSRIGGALAQLAADSVRPQITINEIVVNSISDLHKKNKLVVLETTVNADVTRDESSSSWGVYWGTNVARVIVSDAHVQYYIDLSMIGTGDFDYNQAAKTLTITLPKPLLDKEMVSIDPAKIQTKDLRGGWLRWDKLDTKDRALADLKPNVLVQANASFVHELAQNAGIEAMTSLLKPLAQSLLRDEVTLKIQYRANE